MTLKSYQKILTNETLYAMAALGGTEQLQPNFEIIGGNVDIYVSQTKPASGHTNMFKYKSAVTGMDVFTFVPNYIYIDVTSGSPVVTVSGLQITSP